MERDYIKEAFARMNLQQAISFLLYGSDDYPEETHPYRETLKQGSDPIYKRLESIYPDGIELDRAAADLSMALTAYEYVYMELGMKAGARLVHQLLCVDDQFPTPPLPPIKIK
ncbi:hypothetical protein LJC63_00175 [Ruminococcaceae bacterium OttesenSCG-928-L11]|nr:hypothetical protein [Ruminococcaceae bacterium OttesenSCG-928-L11]